MTDIATIQVLLKYGDWANQRLISAAVELPPDRLDHELDIGRGNLRRTLLHILAGESVWLCRWKEETETPWPDESLRTDPREIGRRMTANALAREQFLASLQPAETNRRIVYRDSKGSLFSATLGDMMLQMCVHSIHHRSQAANIIRRVGGSPPELDYMMSVRVPA